MIAVDRTPFNKSKDKSEQRNLPLTACLLQSGKRHECGKHDKAITGIAIWISPNFRGLLEMHGEGDRPSSLKIVIQEDEF